ncbi:MAG: response regulator [Chloroflexi bacterium]|nr:response regulator [Chloroflexota bacterium]
MSQEQSAANQPSILIVDDTPDNLRLLSNILGRAGYRIRAARNGRIALTSAQATPPDLILLDIMMPDLDGFDVCRRLKADEQTRHIPIIFISALDDVQNIVQSFSLGGVDYITKPFQAEEVLARVNSHITLHRLQKNLKEQVAELDAFAHTVAHDLKNPLSFITGLAEYIQLEYAGNSPAALLDLLQKIEDAGHRGINIIDALLLLASIRKEDVKPVPVDMAPIIANARDRLAYMIHEYQGQLVLPSHWPLAYGHSAWIEEVWVNYLSNGLKYGGRPPRIELGAAEQAEGVVRFWVKDNGLGIPAEKQTILFTEFGRLNQLYVEGYGLGLSIVQRIVHKLGGQVGVLSQLGEGSLFYFDLPAVTNSQEKDTA